ncbi:MAG: VacJ family lipoprotein [Sphingomonadales bacterium]|jgi:phospholipid-binding lipoprotein MlaA
MLGSIQKRLLVSGFFVALVSACATTPPPEQGEHDPFEKFNRATFNFNRVVEHVMLRPTAKVYNAVLPPPIRNGVRNALDNLKGPVVFTNDLLQGEGKRAGTSLGRFVVNTTIGIGGIFDPATGIGLGAHEEDFGQTLAVWGVEEGAYIELPFLGPSTLRDSVGLAGTTLMDPFFWLAREADVEQLSYVRRSVGGIDKLNRNLTRLDDLEQNSLDYYAALRSLYLQDRRAEILNSTGEELPEFPDYDEEFSDAGLGDE